MEIFFTIILVVIVIIGGNYADKESCDKKTTSFKSHEYSFLGGCMIELEDGKKIPLENYKVIN